VFDDVQEAQKFITDVMQPFHEMNRRTIDKKIIQIEKEVNDLSQNLGESVKKKLRPIISELNRELNKDFEVSLSIPNPSFPKIDLDLDIAAASLVRTEKQTKSYSERRWYTLWLCEHRVEYTVTEHKVDPRMLRETIKKTICSSVKQCSETLDAYISNSFQKNVSNYLCEIASILKRMNFALDEAIATRQENATTQIAQKSQFLALEEEFCTLVKRSTQAQNKLNTELGDMDDK
jgi:hypothetical protein